MAQPVCFFRDTSHRVRKVTDFEGCTGLSLPEKEYLDKLLKANHTSGRSSSNSPGASGR